MGKLLIEVQSKPEFPSVQYTAGTLMAEQDGDLVQKRGFYTEKGLSPEVDDAMSKAGVPTVVLIHKGSGGEERKVEHWWFPILRAYPITKGIPANTTAGCLTRRNVEQTKASGVIVSWGSKEFDGKPAKSSVAIPVFLHECGTQVFYLRFRGTMTDYILRALMEHQQFVLAANKITSMPLAMYDYQWRLGASKTPEVVGKMPNAQKQMYPPVYLGVRDLKDLTEATLSEWAAPMEFDSAVEAVWDDLQKTSSSGFVKPQSEPTVPQESDDVVKTGVFEDARKKVSRIGTPFVQVHLIGKENFPCVCFKEELFGDIITYAKTGETVTVFGRLSTNNYGTSLIVDSVAAVGQEVEDDIPF